MRRGDEKARRADIMYIERVSGGDCGRKRRREEHENARKSVGTVGMPVTRLLITAQVHSCRGHMTPETASR